MEYLSIDGGYSLNGKVTISGMKNSALPIIFACLLIEEECIIENVPRVSDIENALTILQSMGAIAEFIDTNTVLVDTSKATCYIKSENLICKMRASSYLLGAMLSRFGSVSIPMPGGCNFGVRPIDLHLKGFMKLGASCEECNGYVSVKVTKSLKCNKITLDKISVGATINMVLASVLLDGTTIIENSAMEPHVDDLIMFLNSSGANIKRVGATIFCYGVSKLHRTRYRIYPDMIEALTYITFLGICKGSIELTDVNVDHLYNELKIFEKMNFNIHSKQNSVVINSNEIYGVSVETAPYPYFPTDLHPQFASLLCYANGGGVITENVFPTRFAYVDELRKMGANIARNSNSVHIIESKLTGTMLNANDLRAGAALVAAALGAKGNSKIFNVNYIVRGYENLVEKLTSLGAKIKLIKEN